MFTCRFFGYFLAGMLLLPGQVRATQELLGPQYASDSESKSGKDSPKLQEILVVDVATQKDVENTEDMQQKAVVEKVDIGVQYGENPVIEAQQQIVAKQCMGADEFLMELQRVFDTAFRPHWDKVTSGEAEKLLSGKFEGVKSFLEANKSFLEEKKSEIADAIELYVNIAEDRIYYASGNGTDAPKITSCYTKVQEMLIKIKGQLNELLKK